MATSQWLDEAPDADARTFLTACCGSARWVERMLSRRPFGSDPHLHAIAREEWFRLTPEDWREAFAQHPRIGDRTALAARFPQTAHLSSDEQRGVGYASNATLEELARLNQAYEEKFGYIFIVCATGRSAEEMLTMLRERLRHDPDAELPIAAAEQAEITALRLRRG